MATINLILRDGDDPTVIFDAEGDLPEPGKPFDELTPAQQVAIVMTEAAMEAVGKVVSSDV